MVIPIVINSKNAGMYFYEDSETLTIDAADIYHLIRGFTSNSLSGWTFVAGSTGAIASVITSDGGTTITCTDVAHGLLTGDIISITGSSESTYDGVYEVTYLTNDTFKVTVAYAADATATWAEGDYLLAGPASNGNYSIDISISGNSAVAAKRFKFEAFKNASEINTAVFEMTPSGTNIQSGSAPGTISIEDGDRIFLSVMNHTDSTNFTVVHGHVRLQREGYN